jgi:hypothetical protein
VRRLIAALALLLTFRGLAVEEPFVLQAGVTNVLSLPEKSECVWLGFERMPRMFGLSVSSNTIADHYTIKVEPLGDGTFAAPLPKAECEFITACRLKVNGRWRSIHPVLIDRNPVTTNTEIKLGETFKGVLKGSPAQLPIHFKHLKWSRKGETTENVEIVANRIGSPLDPTLRFIDRKQREDFNDDGPRAGRDSILSLGFGERIDGVLEIADVANATGSEYFYCVRTQYPPLSHSGPPCALAIYDPLHPSFVAMSRLEGPHEEEPNDRPVSAVRTLLDTGEQRPTWGSFERKGDVDWYSFVVSAGQRIIASAKTRELGGDCDAALALYDERGKLLGESVGAGADGPSITNKVATDGVLRLEVKEISRRTGTYWLTIKEAKPGVVLTTEVERVDLPKEGEAKIKIACRRYEYEGEVRLEFDGLPEEVSVVDNLIPKGKNEAEVKLKREKEGEGFQVRITGVIENKEAPDTKVGFPVSTMPALRKLYPLQMFPCAAMDGWIAVNPAP